jgi:hypothetical protein
MEPDYRDLPQDPPHIPYPTPRTLRVITHRSGPVAYREEEMKFCMRSFSIKPLPVTDWRT